MQQYAPDLLSSMEIQGASPQREIVNDPTGKGVTLIGMRVKGRNKADGLYFLVTVAADNSVMIF